MKLVTANALTLRLCHDANGGLQQYFFRDVNTKIFGFHTVKGTPRAR